MVFALRIEDRDGFTMGRMFRSSRLRPWTGASWRMLGPPWRVSRLAQRSI